MEMGKRRAGYRRVHRVSIRRCEGKVMHRTSLGYLPHSSVYLFGYRCISISFPTCSTHFAANASSVKRLLEARARFRIASVASSDIESASAKHCAYSDSVLAW